MFGDERISTDSNADADASAELASDLSSIDLLLQGSSSSGSSSSGSLFSRNGLVGSSLVTNKQEDVGERSHVRNEGELQAAMSRLAGHGLFGSSEGGGGGEEGPGTPRGDAPSSSSSSSTTALFKDNVTMSVRKDKKAVADLSYQMFIDRLMHPQCEHLVAVTR